MATVFSFVRRLMEVRRAAGVFVAEDGPAVLLSSLLLALGERARLEDARELTFVRVALEEGDLRRLPPHALVLRRRGGSRSELALDPREEGGPLGFLPRAVRRGIGRRRAISAASF